MGWQPTNPATIEAAARVAIAAGFPAAAERSHDPRPTPEAAVPAFAVRVEPEDSTPASMGTADQIVTGSIRLALWIKAPHDSDRRELAAVADHARALLMADPSLAAWVGALDPADTAVEITAEAERIARLDLTLSAEWLEASAATPAILARFGLA